MSIPDSPDHPDAVVVRSARPSDLPAILQLVHALAEYEREPDAVEAGIEDFAQALFPQVGAPTAFTEVATRGDQVVGMAIWFTTFSTWTGRPGIWLEDLFVQPTERGSGAGTALLARLARICRERDYRRLEWAVLRWNTPSIGFYESLGAVPQSDWERYRLSGDPLGALAQAGAG